MDLVAMIAEADKIGDADGKVGMADFLNVAWRAGLCADPSDDTAVVNLDSDDDDDDDGYEDEGDEDGEGDDGEE